MSTVGVPEPSESRELLHVPQPVRRRPFLNSGPPPESGYAPPQRRRRHIGLIILLLLAVAIAVLVLLWDWDWFRPLVERRASATLGRKVTMTHFDVKLSRHPTAIADGVEIANPDGFPEAPYFAHIDRLAVTADAMAYWRGRNVVIDRVAVTKPVVNALQHPDGRATWDFPAWTAAKSDAAPSKPAKIGAVAITDGQAHVVVPRLKADFQVAIATRSFDSARPPAPEIAGVKAPEPATAAAPAPATAIPASAAMPVDPTKPDQIVLDAKGTYAGQPITGHAVGGALLSLRDATTPYSIDATLDNGPTKMVLVGTVEDPLHFKGTDLKLHLTGPNMALLFPLTGVPIPTTPPYDIAGDLGYTAGKIRFTDFVGRLGSSDLGGTITIDPGPVRPMVDANLVSKRVDLADLGGFIGSQPGRVNTPDQTAEQKAAVEKADASSKLLPDTPINLPKFKSADVRLDYKGEHIEGRSVPFDAIAVKLDIDDGRFKIHPVSLQVGRGQIVTNADLAPAGDGELNAKVDTAFDHVDISRLLAATHAVQGAGLLGGRAELVGTGNSIASLVGHGDGGLRLLLAGGSLSALLVDLSGLEFGNALLSAIGIPRQAKLECFVADFALRRGVLDTNVMILSTSEADVVGSGDIDLGREALNFRLRTNSRHLSVGSLPADIGIKGTFKSPSIQPNLTELAVRGGAAVALGVLLTPAAALLPTVQFGTGDENVNRCEAVLHSNGKRLSGNSAASPPAARAAKPARGKAAARKPTL